MTDNELAYAFTATYDYSDYSANDSDISHSSPCNNTTMKDFTTVFLATLYSLVFILGFIGNGLVVCVLVKHHRQTNLTDLCLCNLALSDLLFVLTLPFYTRFIVVKQWTFGDFMCRFISGSHQTGFFSSIFFMIVMTLERYMAIMHALKVARYRTIRVGIILTVLVWTLSVCVSLPNYIFTTVTSGSSGDWCDYSPENVAWDHFNLLTTNVLGLITPSLVMTICYSRIIPRLVNMKSVKKHRVVKLIIFIMVIFFVFWAPYNISLFLKFLTDQNFSSNCTWNQNLQLSITITETFAYTHCCLNPVIYAFVGEKFMIRAARMLKSWIPSSSRASLDNSVRRSSVFSRSSEVTSTTGM